MDGERDRNHVTKLEKYLFSHNCEHKPSTQGETAAAALLSEGVTAERLDGRDPHCCRRRRRSSVHMAGQCLSVVRLLYAPLPQWKVECLPKRKHGCIY